jgi:hypothetical protein
MPPAASIRTSIGRIIFHLRFTSRGSPVSYDGVFASKVPRTGPLTILRRTSSGFIAKGV